MCKQPLRFSAALLALAVALLPATAYAQSEESEDGSGLEPASPSSDPAFQSDEGLPTSPAEKPAQRRLAIGLITGINVAYGAMGAGAAAQLGTQPYPIDSSARAGVAIGLVGNVQLTKIFGLRLGIQYAQKGARALLYTPAAAGGFPPYCRPWRRSDLPRDTALRCRRAPRLPTRPRSASDSPDRSGRSANGSRRALRTNRSR